MPYGLVTYLTRVSGLIILRQFKLNKFMKNWLTYLPGTILSATLAPLIITGIAELLTGLVVLTYVIFTGRLASGIIIGAIFIFGLRTILF